MFQWDLFFLWRCNDLRTRTLQVHPACEQVCGACLLAVKQRFIREKWHESVVFESQCLTSVQTGRANVKAKGRSRPGHKSTLLKKEQPYILSLHPVPCAWNALPPQRSRGGSSSVASQSKRQSLRSHPPARGSTPTPVLGPLFPKCASPRPLHHVQRPLGLFPALSTVLSWPASTATAEARGPVHQ